MPFTFKLRPALAIVFLLSVLLVLPAPQPAAANGGSMPYLQSMSDVERVLTGSRTLVLVQFDAKWCGYCRALQPHLEKLRAQHRMSALEIYKIDIDQSRDIAVQFQVSTLPTMFMVYKGKVVGYKRGAMDEGALFAWVDSVQRDIGRG